MESWGSTRPRSQSAAIALSFRLATSVLCPMGQTHFGVYHSPASLVLCISQRPPRENGSLSLWWGNAKHLSTRFCCTRSRTGHGRKEKQEPLAGAAGGITGCRVRLRQGNTLTALMTLVAARTLAALQVASVPRAVRRASMARALTLPLISLHPSRGQESWDQILHGCQEDRVILWFMKTGPR